MGFCYDAYLTEEAVEQSDLSTAQCMLLGLVADEETVQTLSDTLPELETPDSFDLSDAADDRRAQCTSRFTGTSSGFSAEITLDSDNYVFFSVPNDEGWRATVNGELTEIVTVNYGLCAVRCEAGDSTIEFTYHTPWLSAGAAVSALSIFFFVLLSLRCRKKPV